MVVVLKNNKRSVLRQLLASSDTLVVVSDSTIFPTLAVGEYFYLTILRSDGASEIVKVLSVSGASLTVVRAQEGTVAREFPVGSGVEMRVTAASVLEAAADAVDALTLGDLGITATAAELNVLDGVTATTPTLNASVSNSTQTRDTVAALLADTTLTYTAGQIGTVTAGGYVRTRSEGFSYQVAASGAANHDIATAGGVKLYVVAVRGAFHVDAFGAAGNNSQNDVSFFQQAFRAVQRVGGAEVHWGGPGKVYRIQYTVTTPALVMGANTVFRKVCPGSYINLDLSTRVPLQANPPGRIAICGAIGCGDVNNFSRPTAVVLPNDRYIVSSGFVPSDFLEGIQIIGLDLRCSFGGTLTGTERFVGVELWNASGVLIDDVRIEGTPNTGLVLVGGSNHRVSNVITRRCGFGAVNPSTRNGISLTGLMIVGYPELSSANWHISNVITEYNHDEGLQFAAVKGIVLSGITGRGNLDRFIEGDTSYASTTINSSTYSQEIPNEVLISDVIYDALYSDGSQRGVGGIAIACANEARVSISNVRIRNITGTGNSVYPSATIPAVAVSQALGGRVNISDVAIENCTFGTNASAVYVKSEHIHVSDVSILGCSTASNSAAFTFDSAIVATLKGAFVDAGLNNCVSAVGSVAMTLLSVSNVECLGVRRSFLSLGVAAAISSVAMRNNTCFGLNTVSSSDNGVIQLGNNALTIGSLIVRENMVRCANIARYPIIVGGGVTIANGAIGLMDVRDNDFGTRQFSFNFGVRVDIATAITTTKIESRNGMEGQREMSGNAAPTAGHWVIGDTMRNLFPSAGGTTEWRCTTTGTFGTLAGVTGSITSGTTSLTVNDASAINVNDSIAVVGVSGARRVIGKSGNVLTLESAADATVSGAAVSYVTPVFKAVVIAA